MEEKNELGDIILNKSSKEGGSKKVVLAAATLGIILIVVVLLMNTLSSDNENNLPQNALPPKPVKAETKVQKEEPLFEDVEVIDEKSDSEDEKLAKIAQELKEQNKQPEEEKTEEKPTPVAKTPVKHSEPVHKTQKTAPTKPAAKKSVVKGHYYVQVGSFTRYKPNKKFLYSIKKAGYSYTFHKASVHGRSVTKVLVGPFKSERDARSALKKIKQRIQKDAFITKI